MTHPFRVLVVDDHADAADSTARLLDLYGYDARVARDGPAALADAATFPPDVVLLELGMPGMDGYELAAKLRDGAARRRPLVVAVSWCATAGEHRRSAAADIDLHLDKPADPEVLVGVLRGFERGPVAA